MLIRSTYNKLQLEWFCQTFNNKGSGILGEPPAKLFVVAGGDGRKPADEKAESLRRREARKRLFVTHGILIGELRS